MPVGSGGGGVGQHGEHRGDGRDDSDHDGVGVRDRVPPGLRHRAQVSPTRPIDRRQRDTLNETRSVCVGRSAGSAGVFVRIQSTVARRPSANGTGSMSGNSASSRVLSAWLWGTSPARLSTWLRSIGWPRIPSSTVERVEQRDAAAEGEVDRVGAGDRCGSRASVIVGADRADVGEVAALGAVAVHGDRLAAQRRVDEGGDDGGVDVAGRLHAGRTR